MKNSKGLLGKALLCELNEKALGGQTFESGRKNGKEDLGWKAEPCDQVRGSLIGEV